MRVVSLYCGLGGFDEAIKQAYPEAKTIFAADLDPDFLEVWKSNHDAEHVYEGDLADWFDFRLKAQRRRSELRIKDMCGDVDLLVAGPPCVGHSKLNVHTRGFDEQNQLYFLASRAIKILNPKVAIIENVPQVRNCDFEVVNEAKAEHDRRYWVWEQILDAQDFGVPQRRRRHFQFFVRSDCWMGSGLAAPLTFPTSPKKTVYEAIGAFEHYPDSKRDTFHQPPILSERNKARIDYLFDNGLYEGQDLPDSLKTPSQIQHGEIYPSMFGRMYPDRPAPTIIANIGISTGRYIHPTQRRLINPFEASILQGFPVGYDFSAIQKKGKLYRTIGNAVSPPVVAGVVSGLISCGVLGRICDRGVLGV